MSSWLIEALIGSSLLMLLVLFIRRPVAAQFGPRVAYWLWLLPALRMAMPALPRHWFTESADPLPQTIPAMMLEMSPGVTAAAADIATSSTDIVAAILAVFVIGAVGHFTVHLWAYHRFARRVAADATLLREIDPGAIQVLATREVTGPLAMGLTRATILVPHDFDWRYDDDERECAIAHEVAHHRRGDLKVNFAALALLSLHWWNPLAHMAYRAFRTDQELACDATIMADADADSRHAYGRALVKSACDRAPLATCALNRKQELKRRLRMMRFGPLSAARGAVASAFGFGVIAGGLLVTASVGASAAADTKVGRLVQDGIEDGGAVVAAAIADTDTRATLQADAEIRAAEAEQVAAQVEAKAGEIEAQLGEREAHASNDDQREVIAAEREAAQDEAEQAREAAEDAREAAQEAMRDAREAQREAMTELLAEIRAAEREALAAVRDGDDEARMQARKAADAARAALRQMQGSWNRVTPPVPPVAPTPPAPPTAPAAPTPPVVPVLASKNACTGKSGSETRAMVESKDGKMTTLVASRACAGTTVRVSQIDLRQISLHALQSARHQLAAMTHLTDTQRRAALQSIDVEIADLKRQLN